MGHPFTVWNIKLVILLVGLLGQNCEGYDLRGHDGGSCKEYYAEGGACSDYLGGMMVWEYDGISLEDWDAILQVEVGNLKSQTQAIAMQDCQDAFFKMLCMSWFPPCSEDNEPRRFCDSVCRYVRDDVCKSAFTVVQNIGLGSQLPNCDRLIGDPAGSQAYAYYEYLNAWEGTDMFPSIDVEPTCADLTVSKEVACKKKKCLFPLMEYRTPRHKNASTGLQEWQNPDKLDYCKNSVHESPDDFDCEQCESFCAFRCDPYPVVYSEDEYRLLHVMTFLPGFLGIPLNILVFFVEIKKVRAMKKWNFTDLFILLSAGLSILLFFIEPLPSAIFGKEMRCNYEDVYTWEFDLQQEHAVCKVGKLRLHVVQALLFCVVGTLYKVFRQLKASLSMTRYSPGISTRLLFMFLILVLPLILSVLTLSMDTDQLYEMSMLYRMSEGGPGLLYSLNIANRLRYAYSCGPRFANENLEMAIVHIPMLLAGATSVILSILLLHIVFVKMGGGITTKSSTKQRNQTLAKLAMNMIRFAFVSTLLVAINASATLQFVPQSVHLGFMMEDWFACATTGIDYRKARGPDGKLYNISLYTNKNLETVDDLLKHCGRFDDFKPNFSILVSIALSNGLPPLAFGLVFALPALRQFKQLLQRSVYKVTPGASSGATSTTASALDK